MQDYMYIQVQMWRTGKESSCDSNKCADFVIYEVFKTKKMKATEAYTYN